MTYAIVNVFTETIANTFEAGTRAEADTLLARLAVMYPAAAGWTVQQEVR